MCFTAKFQLPSSKFQPMTTISIPNIHAIHIADLFFHAEISQAVGSDASDAWLRQQRTVCPSKQPIHSPKSAISNTRSAAPRCRRETSSDLRSEHGRSSKGSYQIKESPTESRLELESEIASIRRLLDGESQVDIGLLYTDAAHTVLHRFDRLNSF